MAVGAETIITDIPGYMPGISYPSWEDVIYKNLVMLVGEEHAAPASAEKGRRIFRLRRYPGHYARRPGQYRRGFGNLPR